MEYKDTLFMPKTSFEMKGNLKQKDPLFIKKTNNLLNKINDSKTGSLFVLHDGPPYANGNIHVGHALNKILKDIIVREKLLNNRPVDWRIGFDTHGLPIENKIQQLGFKVSEIGKEEYLIKAKEYVLEQVKNQIEQFKSFNMFTDYKKRYVTLDPKYEKAEIEIFHAMLNKDLVYQDLKPVYWSWSSVTALAEAEIEYVDKESDSIFVKFKLNDLNILIWTTTPWTLSANVALAFGKDIQYSVYELHNEKYVLAESLKGVLENKMDVEFKFVKNFNPQDYIGQEAINPLNGNKSKLVFGHHVTIDGGTGIVHIAGGHGEDDFIITKENNIDLIVVIDDKGHMQNAGKYDGMFYLKANKEILADLKEGLLFSSKFTHSVPIDWRTKKPVVYRATKQWFVSISKIKDELIKNIKEAKWFPSWGEQRLIDMTENRNDWGISRQRLWGVPIPIIYDENKKPIINKELQENIEKLYEEQGILGWHKVEIKDLLPSSIPFVEGMIKEMDILDVWFDSGSSFNALNINKADLYLEGNDQYRGWFNSSLITSTVLNGQAPYRKVITHGFVTDGKGDKMSKSSGNVIDPLEITSTTGADILRLWVASSDYTDNVKISEDILKQVQTDYRKIRNTIRFMLGSISGYDNSTEVNTSISKAILSNISTSFHKIKEFYKKNEYVSIMKEIMNQLNNGAISIYNEISKDIIYIQRENDPRRREAQYVISTGLQMLLYTLAPFIPTTIEEAYETLLNKEESIFLTNHPTIDFKSKELLSDFNDIRTVVNKAIEELKEVKKSQEVSIVLSLPKELEIWKQNLKGNLLIADISFEEGELKVISAKKAKDFHKCERCWRFFPKAEISNENICDSCSEIVKFLNPTIKERV